MNKTIRTLLLISSATAFAPVFVEAGTLGATSDDTLGLTLNKNTLVRVSQVDDIDLGTFAVVGAAGLQGSDALCLYSNTGALKLTLTSGNGGLTGFVMNNGVADLAYTVEVEQPSGGLGGLLSGLLNFGAQPAQSGVELYGIESSSDENCSGGTNLDLTVAVSQANFQLAPAGTYTDTIAIFVRPE